MFCKFCGARNDDDAIFCRSCGKKIGEQETKGADGAENENPFTSNTTNSYTSANYNPFAQPSFIKRPISVKALVGFIVSISMFVIADVFALIPNAFFSAVLLEAPAAVVGIVFTSISFRDFSERKKRGLGFAISGLVIASFMLFIAMVNLSAA